ncbi:MAG TPA: penicillin-binding protein 1C [Lentimicrobium sp.]|nr:penicillin-binding protein 1C [Lentimicrobium sp.]
MIGLTKRSKVTKRLTVVLLSFLFSLLVFIIADLLFPLPDFNKGYSTIIYSSENTIIHCFLSQDDKWRIRADYEEISGELAQTIISKEDQYFYYHPGINPIAVFRAAFNNILKGRRTSGASTITMQLARIMQPADRNFKSKLREVFRALQLEWHFSKKEILTMYLNHLPYGGNIEGVKSASLIYFNQLPKELSPAQIVMLTVIPNNPNNLIPGKRSALIMKRNYWLLKLGHKGIFSKQEVEDALVEGFESKRFILPKAAPHLSYRLKNSGNDRIYTSLKIELQSKVEALLANYVRPLRSLQITNAAVLIVDNHTRKVLAYAGSAGFDEEIYSGQVDGVRALRSPGSTLKPALYLLGFDKGLISPKTVVTDVPVNFGGYRPENYDETYRGQVTIEQALSLSLNVPAVELLDQIGVGVMNQTLANAGFNWIRVNSKRTGLSMILGGCGTSLEELTGLYSALANKGIWKKLQFTDHFGNVDTLGKRIGSPAGTYMITQILTELKRPDLPNEYLESAKLPRIAWKTGTSYGRKDAWAIGYNADFTVGVWTGNFDGQGVPELNGSDCAVPLLFMIFNQLPAGKDEWFTSTPDADFRLVCSITGMPADTFCHNLVMETFIPGISPSQRCNHQKKVFTNAAGTISYCNECLPETGYKATFYPNYTPELISYYEDMLIPYKKIPEHNPECTALNQNGIGPVITSLTDGAEYLVFAGKKQQLMLKSSCANGTTQVYWYIDTKFCKKAKPGEPVYIVAEKGNHILTCSDDRGRSSSIRFTVTPI